MNVAIFVADNATMNTAYLSLGSNEGNREGMLEDAILRIAQTCGPVLNRSSFYETAAWGVADQPDFLNMALYIHTSLKPVGLLAAIRHIESELGRQRTVRWGQRTIDIDILFYNTVVIDTPELVIPHPRLQERGFVLVPMNEIAADLKHPITHKTINEMLAVCPDRLEVKRVTSDIR